jgi:hypothetical protein
LRYLAALGFYALGLFEFVIRIVVVLLLVVSIMGMLVLADWGPDILLCKGWELADRCAR